MEKEIYYDIKESENWQDVTPIEKGWSNEKKYIVTTFENERYLLRIAPLCDYEKIKSQVDDYKKIGKIKHIARVPQIYSFGLCNTNQNVYTILEYIEGDDLIDTLPKLDEKNQYDLGLKAGFYLKKIHSIKNNKKKDSWKEYFSNKVDKKINLYQELDTSDKSYFDTEATILIDYLNENKNILTEREQVLQHGDYHVGNMILIKNNDTYDIGIIDFNRMDYGDPYEEFNRIILSANCSPIFATGIIDGYFNNLVPIDFWPLLTYYIASNTLSSFSWSISFGLDEMSFMKKQASNVLSWFDNLKATTPSWYTKYHVMYQKKERVVELDILRGFAFFMMAFDHTMYDLGFLFNSIYQNPTLKNICISAKKYVYSDTKYIVNFIFCWGIFILVSGICATLTKNNVKRGIKLALVSLTLSTITILAQVFLPSFGFNVYGIAIYYGMLHCLATCMILSPLLLKLKNYQLVIISIIVIIIGFYNKTLTTNDSYFIIFNLLPKNFVTADFQPLFPNIGYYIWGIIIGRTLYKNKTSLFPNFTFNKKYKLFPFNVLTYFGKNTLIWYFLHQIIIVIFLALFYFI